MLNKDSYFTGTIVEVVNPVLYQIKVDIPGIAVSVNAFPMRGEIDEPRVGDFVLLRSLDPVFSSYYLYQKIKENDFIGFRSNGKIVDITPDYITVGIFDPTIEYNDLGAPDEEEFGGTGSKYVRPELTDWIKLDKEGNLEVNLRTNSIITIQGASTIKIAGNAEINVEGTTNLTCPEVNITSSTGITLSGGSLKTTNGSCSSTGMGGFCGIPVCPFSGAPHVGNEIVGI